MQKIDRLLAFAHERCDFPLSCLGIGLISTWSELSFIHSPLFFGNHAQLLFQFFNLSTIVSMTAVALLLKLGKITHTLVSRDANLVATLGLLAASTTLSFFSVLAWGGNLAALVLAAVLGGTGLGLLFVMWFEVVSHLKPIDLLLCYALGCTIRVLLIWLGSGMTPERQGAWLGLIALAALFSLRSARQAVAPDAPILARSKGPLPSDGHPTEERCSFPLRPLAFVTTGTLALSFALGMGGNVAGTNGNPGVLAAAVLAIGLVVAKSDAFQFKWLWQLSLGLIVAALIAFVCFGAGSPLLSGFLVCASYELCLMLVYSILGDLVYRSFYNSTFLFSVEIGIALSAGMAGDLLFKATTILLPGHAPISTAIVGSLLVLLFALTSVRTFSYPEPKGRWSKLIKKPIGQDVEPLLERSRLGLRCHELAESAGLSTREEEVLLLLAQRKKPSAIAQQLVIEVSTVNTHKKHIYRKLDVHSAQELQRRISQAEEEHIRQGGIQ